MTWTLLDHLSIAIKVVSIIITLIFFAAIIMSTAPETLLTYKSISSVLERYGEASNQFQDIKPTRYCNKVGYRMALEDFRKTNRLA